MAPDEFVINIVIMIIKPLHYITLHGWRQCIYHCYALYTVMCYIPVNDECPHVPVLARYLQVKVERSKYGKIICLVIMIVD